MSKIESENCKLNYEEINSELLINEVMESLNLFAREKKLEVKIDLAPICLSADKKMFIQILHNLLINAIKFTPDKGQLLIETYEDCEDFIFSVKDTGIGIDEADYEMIFDKFKQVESLYTKNEQGIGVGLSIVKKLVDLHNGRVYVESIKNVGSTFSFRIPLAPKKVIVKA